MSTYYVAITGDDLNDGSSNSEFLTLQKAANTIAAGDTVIVRDGIYKLISANDYLLQITTTGTVSQPITFRSENKWGAILDGDITPNNGTFEVGYGIRIGSGASYINIEDFEIRNFIYCGIISNEYPIVSHDIRIEGCKIHDINRTESDYPYGLCAIYLTRGSSYWNITRNLMYDIGKTGPDSEWLNTDHAVYTGATEDRSIAAHHINITYNIIWGCSGHALSIGSDNDLYANNVIAWTKETHRYGLNNPLVGTGFVLSDAGCKNITVVNNVFYQPSMNSEGQPWAIGSWGHYEGHVIKNNVIYGGRMFESGEYNDFPAEHIAALKGDNYGRTDCEYPEIDPLFVSAIKDNVPNVDFSLRSTSSLISAGTNVGLTKDFLGNLVSPTTPSIGAYEYIEDITTTTSSSSSSTTTSTTITTTTTVPITSTTTTTTSVTSTTTSTTTILPITSTTSSTTLTSSSSTTTSTTTFPITTTSTTTTYDITTTTTTTTLAPVIVTTTTTSTIYVTTTTTTTHALTTTTTTLHVYSNIQTSGSASKNNCPSGYTTSPIIYTVLEGSYTSTISQEYVDNLAINDVSINKQKYANLHGICTPLKFYYNIKMQITVTRNNCPRGYKGSTVTYIVNAKKYSSTISQADANNKALNDLNTNKQIYANNCGTCKKSWWCW